MRLSDRNAGPAIARLRGALLVTTAVLALGATQALAQQRQPDAMQVAQVAPGFGFAIPAGNLPQALNEFGRVTGLTVLFTQEAALAAQSPGVAGQLTAEAALARLLAGTGWTWRFTNAQTVTLAAAPAIQGGGAVALPPVEVTAVRGTPPTGTIGAPPPPFAGGQVGSGARLGLLGNRGTFDTPFSVTGYTERLIRDQQARTVADAAANDSSVRSLIPRNSFSDQFFIRGFGLFPYDIGFDGLYGIVDIRRPAIEGIERVEILRGPNTLLNGVAPLGIGGGINLIPKRAADQPLTRFTTGVFSRNEFSNHIDVGRRYGENKEWGVRFNGAYRSGDSAVDDSSVRFSTFSLGLDYRGQRFRLSSDLGYHNEDINGVTQTRGVRAGFAIPKAPDGRINVSQPWESLNHSNLYGTLRGEYDVTDAVTVFAGVGANRYREDTLFGAPQIINPAGDTLTNVNAGAGLYTNKTGEAGVRGRLATGPVRHEATLTGVVIDRPFDSYNLTVATGIRSNIYSPLRVARPTFNEPDLRRSSVSINRSLALADTLSILDERVMLTLGGRMQQIESRGYARTGATTSSYDESKFTPAIGLVIKPIRPLSLYANYIEALQEGATAPTTAINAGEVFSPFVGKQYEVGAKYDLGVLGLGLAAFDIQQPSSFTDPATRRFGVDGLQRNRGLEFSVFGEPRAGLRLLSGVTLLDGELEKTAGGLTDGRTPAGVPSVQLNLYGEYDLPFTLTQGLTLTGRVIHTSSQYYDAANTQSIPGWTRLDLGARYTFIRTGGQPVTLRANVENVAGKDYWAATGRGFLTPGAPRTYLASASFDF